MSLETGRNQELNDEHIDTEVLRLHLPESHKDLFEILRVFDQFNLEECEKNAVKGREMMMELQRRVDELGPNVVNELYKMCQNAQVDPTLKIEEIKEFIFPTLDVTTPDYHRVLTSEMDDKRQRDGIYKAIIVKYILDSLLIKIYKDPNLQHFIKEYLEVFITAHNHILDSGDVALADAVSGKFQEYFMLINYLYFRRFFQNLDSYRMREGDRKMLSELNDELFQQLLKDRVYDIDEIYTEDNMLGKPVIEVFQRISDEKYFREEGIAIVMLTNKQTWDRYTEEQENAISNLRSHENIMNRVRSQINDSIGNMNMAKQLLKRIESGPTIHRIPNSLNIIIRWSDGQLILPGSLILFKELFTEDEQDWVEMLRFSLLSKLRSMLVPDYKDPTVRVISDLKKRTKKKGKKISMKKIKEKIFPRIRRKEFIIEGHTICSVPRKAPKGHKVIGHKRKLPEGFYASPAAAERARQLGINLDFIVDENLIKRYTETYVQTHHRGKEKIDQDRKGKFRKKA